MSWRRSAARTRASGDNRRSRLSCPVRDAPTDVCELRLEAQHALDELWDPLELGDQSRVLIDIESAAHVSEMQSEQEAARHALEAITHG